ncbi:hypothetical protein A2526_00370 [candidate division WOR-1 bacterium RIFOXYD2_FULL_36_8]|uniref:Ribbon-helix-helix protein CopG domain-containing protein n=1 Tax=candidate division WOR-1 bacterium RIFOXYB2_FULL_36_35 TaxID=1802578 RepID=A0A1F4S1X6_UNCSA|nr:MAG: hypothetical protein A2230_03775 [candidate division WOR-1 bacterium RIFOXYA2_FULL_36_21]OGC14445.1 MAG: hypothetical protein A2290_08470 [candidate division WOR-1 bacterium RIFOXYB2_FULL_36_35]OGC18543.1 MAG: hypothetical protein A2282_03200 [candidate division WOR-1 bacterium RIFOXYA12_FULL_36_13]OGC37525.1 MAG: hypothetical protein A2526_00370 [candidate division WOR-1 bacterium RIFOXYD2_FULL_36_8]
MHRTQIYLDDRIFEFLEKERKKTHTPLSEIIRNSIKKNIKDNVDSIISKMNKVSGAWEKISISPNKYLRKMREDRLL